ncbi:hypothetical protein [Mycobacterium sp. UM_CSW]|uniref:hypothetical protein n=1 Tax=Mycobacterium sp. UM_CSW TaxID=1370119 RepID=UPI000427DAC3|nr:hypothetical protein [Mycobacterium sp. UM_CSW]
MAALPCFEDLWNGVTCLAAAPPPVDPLIERLRQISQQLVEEKRAMDRRAQQVIRAMQAVASAAGQDGSTVQDDTSVERWVVTE